MAGTNQLQRDRFKASEDEYKKIPGLRDKWIAFLVWCFFCLDLLGFAYLARIVFVGF